MCSYPTFQIRFLFLFFVCRVSTPTPKMGLYSSPDFSPNQPFYLRPTLSRLPSREIHVFKRSASSSPLAFTPSERVLLRILTTFGPLSTLRCPICPRTQVSTLFATSDDAQASILSTHSTEYRELCPLTPILFSHSRVRREAIARILARARSACSGTRYRLPKFHLSLPQGRSDHLGSTDRQHYARHPASPMGAHQ